MGSKKKQRVIPTPKDADGAADSLRQIGEVSRRIALIAVKRDADVAKIREDADAELDPLKERMGDLITGLATYAKDHRHELIPGDAKTVTLGSAGTISWRWTPRAVVIAKKVKVADVIKEIIRRKLVEFLRPKDPDLNREALAENPEVASTLDGVSIRRTERLYLTPAGSDAEIEGPDVQVVVVTAKSERITA